MKVAVLSDLHANQAALEAVLEDAFRHNVERFWSLGDTLGYGPDPHVPLMWLQHYVQPDDWRIGNHDAMFCGLISSDEASNTARQSLDLNRRTLEMPENEDALAFCQAEFTGERMEPSLQTLDGVDYYRVHSSQKDYVGERRYIYPWQEEIFLPEEFQHLHLLSLASGLPCVQFYGHTHVPTLVFGRLKEQEICSQAVRVYPDRVYSLDTELAIINPGSVGFPRDLNNRSAYVLLDTGERTVTFRRVSYDWQKTAQKLLRDGYPPALVDRLRFADPDSTTPDDWKAHYRDVQRMPGEAAPFWGDER